MKKENIVSVNHRKLIEKGSWNRRMSEEEGERIMKGPTTKELQESAIIVTAEVLIKIEKVLMKILEGQKDFYDEMLKEKKILENLRK